MNKVHGQRFKLQESLKKLQDCMNLLEKEHAWQGHVDELSVPMQQHQAVVQVHAHTALCLVIMLPANDMQIYKIGHAYRSRVSGKVHAVQRIRLAGSSKHNKRVPCLLPNLHRLEPVKLAPRHVVSAVPLRGCPLRIFLLFYFSFGLDRPVGDMPDAVETCRKPGTG